MRSLVAPVAKVQIADNSFSARPAQPELKAEAEGQRLVVVALAPQVSLEAVRPLTGRTKPPERAAADAGPRLKADVRLVFAAVPAEAATLQIEAQARQRQMVVKPAEVVRPSAE